MNGNPFAGEVIVTLDGVAHRARLTLGALAELEAHLPDHSLQALVVRLESGVFCARDVLGVLAAGLRGAGWQGRLADLTQADIAGGPLAATVAAGQLLAQAFAPQLAAPVPVGGTDGGAGL